MDIAAVLEEKPERRVQVVNATFDVVDQIRAYLASRTDAETVVLDEVIRWAPGQAVAMPVDEEDDTVPRNADITVVTLVSVESELTADQIEDLIEDMNHELTFHLEVLRNCYLLRAWILLAGPGTDAPQRPADTGNRLTKDEIDALNA